MVGIRGISVITIHSFFGTGIRCRWDPEYRSNPHAKIATSLWGQTIPRKKGGEKYYHETIFIMITMGFMFIVAFFVLVVALFSLLISNIS